MSAAAILPPFATDLDFFAIPEAQRFHELLAGEIVHRALPSGRHGASQLRVGRGVGGFDGPDRPDGPGGWRFAVEVEVRLSSYDVVRPDVAGWRRERLAAFPAGVIDLAPDWICEVLSPGHEARDLLDKMSLYHRAGVPHYWVLDPTRRGLRVHRWAEPGYQIALEAGPEATVRVAPFELIELAVASLFDEP